MNKKAQDLSIGTLILIVLGIVVLVLLILGFSLGWSNLWEKINIFQGGSSIGDVVTACKLSVTAQDTYSYCQDFKKIKVDGKVEYVNCLDSRVALGIENKITNCPLRYTSGAESSQTYCNSIKTTLTDKVKINGFDYEKDCTFVPA